MAGPALVIVAGLITFFLAVYDRDGVVHDDYYKQGKVINQMIERDQKAKSLNISAQGSIDGDIVRLHVSALSSLPPELILRLVYPTQDKYDHTITLKALGNDGVYIGDWPKQLRPAKHWTLQLEDPQGEWRVFRTTELPRPSFEIFSGQ
jgi:hypothetical protein